MKKLNGTNWNTSIVYIIKDTDSDACRKRQEQIRDARNKC